MTEPKDTIICPICGKQAKRLPIHVNPLYRCDECGFLSNNANVVNISYKDNVSAPLSNLYPHEFKLYGFYDTSKLSEKAIRYLHRNALQVSPDAQGRILLTKELLAYAGIAKEAVVVGCSSYVEIWSAENYAREIEDEDIENIRRELEMFGL